jgi:Family of unknown function (DUF5947)
VSSGNGVDPLGRVEPGALQILERIRRSAVERTTEERCELCSAPIGEDHQHLVNLESRRLLCSCRPCHLLFVDRGAGGGRYRAIPDRNLALPGFVLGQGDWDGLQIPVSVAFFFVNSVMHRVAAFYPSPAGATESLLPLEAWDQIVAANPVVATLEPDVEALLIRWVGGAPECFVVPIDACYQLVGLLRTRWRGFDGGQDAHDAIDDFFADLRERARTLPPSGEPA